MPTEIQLPPIDKAKTPISSAFDFAEFTAVKGESPEPNTSISTALLETESKPLVKDDALDQEEKAAKAKLPLKEAEDNDTDDNSEGAEQEDKGIDKPLAKRYGADDEDTVLAKRKKEVEEDDEEDKPLAKAKVEDKVSEDNGLKPLVDKRKPLKEGEGVTTVLPGVDLEVLGEEEYEKALPFLKNMSKQSREYFTATVKKQKAELETLKNAKPAGEFHSSYYERPDAYVLAPEFQQAVKVVNTVSSELSHWKEQLAKVNDGEKWTDLQKDAQGNIVTVVREPNGAATVELMEKIRFAGDLVNRYSYQAENVKQTYASKLKQGLTALKTIEEQLFPDLKDEKVAKSNKHYTQLYEVLKSKQLGSNPLATILAKMYAHNMSREEYIAELEEGRDNALAAPAKKAKLGISNGDMDGDGGVTSKRVAKATSDDVFNFEEFEKIKNGG